MTSDTVLRDLGPILAHGEADELVTIDFGGSARPHRPSA